MLRNMIFDMGNVLIRFDPELFADRLGIEDENDRNSLLDKIFRSPDWPRLDSGEMTETELEVRVHDVLPKRLHDLAHQLIFQWDQPIVPIPGMASFVEACRQAGLGIYLLSNASVRLREYWDRIPGHECFDGLVVSAEQRCVKPGKEIYRYLLDTYRLIGAECLFVDDVEANIEAAAREGIRGFHFTGDIDPLRKAVWGLGVPVGSEM